jgi:hypothetical protein
MNLKIKIKILRKEGRREGREGKGREGKGREGKGREGKEAWLLRYIIECYSAIYTKFCHL